MLAFPERWCLGFKRSSSDLPRAPFWSGQLPVVLELLKAFSSVANAILEPGVNHLHGAPPLSALASALIQAVSLNDGLTASDRSAFSALCSALVVEGVMTRDQQLQTIVMPILQGHFLRQAAVSTTMVRGVDYLFPIPLSCL